MESINAFPFERFMRALRLEVNLKKKCVIYILKEKFEYLVSGTLVIKENN